MRSDFLALQTPLLTTGYTPRHTYTHTSLFPLGTHPPTPTRFCYHWVYTHLHPHVFVSTGYIYTQLHIHPHVFVSIGYTPTYTRMSLFPLGIHPAAPTPIRLCFLQGIHPYLANLHPHLHPHVFVSTGYTPSHTYTHTSFFPATPTSTRFYFHPHLHPHPFYRCPARFLTANSLSRAIPLDRSIQ